MTSAHFGQSKDLGGVTHVASENSMSSSTTGRDDLPVYPELTTGVAIGIAVAVAGNVLISLALNLQKLAHKRLTADKESSRSPSPDAPEEPVFLASGSSTNRESAPLLAVVPELRGEYGTLVRPKHSGNSGPGSRLVPISLEIADGDSTGKPDEDQDKIENDENEGEYLKSKLWWFGFILMNVGELGNFISYAWAPASVVAPLGTFALIANCFFSPLILRERFRKRDLLGILVAIIGAVTVVLASNASDTRLDPEALLKAITQVPFLVYSAVYVVGAIVLAILSEGRLGRQWVFVDLGLCALFGGFTVLSTKAISTLLTMQWIDMFRQIITYPVILVLAGTGVGQIKYLNRALMRFDSKIVIPTQFVLFNLSTILGSSILFGDFRKANFHQVVTFFYGCAATFAGVFIIAWAPTSSDSGSNDEAEPLNSDNPGSPESPPTIGRRRGALILPAEITPILRNQRSAVLGLSPAKHLLLVHTPPSEIAFRDLERDFDRHSPESPRKRRPALRFGDDHEGRSSRESSIVGRWRRSSLGAADQSSR
ncbi:DUF803-domain-containing protein [Mycena floridula]|nr:DUF803-domain-containing protein [Mycena floridula]